MLASLAGLPLLGAVEEDHQGAPAAVAALICGGKQVSDAAAKPAGRDANRVARFKCVANSKGRLLAGLHRESSPVPTAELYEVVVRIAVKTKTRMEAEKLRREVEPLAVNGMSGTGKWATSAPGSRIRPVVGLNSALVPRGEVPVTVCTMDLEGITTETDIRT